MMYSYRCPECNIVFDATNSVDLRFQSPCPECGAQSPKVMSISSGDTNFRARWFYNIAPRPVYIKDRKQFTNVANMMGNYSNMSFSKRENGEIKAPVKQEKKEVLRKLKQGDY